MRTMDKQILLLASAMLELASDKFTNHGCNDLSKEVLELFTDEKKICDEIKEWNEDNTSDWPEKANWIGDSTLMHYLSDKLKKEALFFNP